MARVALDASVLLAALRTTDAHHGRALELLRGQPTNTRFVISGSVYAETLVRAHAHRQVERTDAFLDELGVDVIPIDRLVGRKAAALREGGQPRLSLSDALALAPALAGQPPLPFLTFDQSQQERYDQELSSS